MHIIDSILGNVFGIFVNRAPDFIPPPLYVIAALLFFAIWNFRTVTADLNGFSKYSISRIVRDMFIPLVNKNVQDILNCPAMILQIQIPCLISKIYVGF